jgi:hypothetical protein
MSRQPLPQKQRYDSSISRQSNGNQHTTTACQHCHTRQVAVMLLPPDMSLLLQTMLQCLRSMNLTSQ